MKLALIDLGSNSARMYLIEVGHDQSVSYLSQHRVMTRLSQDMGVEKQLKPVPIARTLTVLKDFAAKAEAAGARVVAVATAAVRTAVNGPEFCAAAEREAGIRLHVITGRQEAALDFKGVLAGLSEPESFLITDTGGGSTELILVKERMLQDKISLPFGAVNLSEISGGGKEEEALLQAEARLRPALQGTALLKNAVGLPLLGLGGSAAALGAIAGRTALIHGLSLPRTQVLETFDRLSAMTPAERIEAGIEAGRANTICFGVLPTVMLMQEMDAPRLVISTSGLREGILAEILEQGADFDPNNWELL